MEETKEVAIIRLKVKEDGSLYSVDVWHDPDYSIHELLEAALENHGLHE